jgi:Zn-dependent peptidase ImmA (M78 family)
MLMLEHRLQVLLDEERHSLLTEAARERGVSVAVIVREAIDRGLAPAATRRRAAARHLLEAADMDVPDVVELGDELDALRARRA